MIKTINPQYIPIFLIFPLLGFSYYSGYTPLLVSILFVIISIITFVIYYKDKSAAISGTWRTPESTLHLFSLLCGWPGAIVAQHTLRHKTKKKSFRFVFWLTVVINLAIFSWLHTSEGSKILHSYIYRIDNYLVSNLGSPKASEYILQLTHFNARK